MIWLTIVSMAALVFISRYLFLEPRLPLRLNDNLQKVLAYAAPAVLTAIITPIVWISDHQISLSIDNSYLVGTIFACLLAYFTRNTLLTVLASMALFFSLM